MKIPTKNQLMLIFISFLFYNANHAQQLEAQFDYAQFQTQESAFIETYISIESKSIRYVENEKNEFVGTVLITMLFYKDNKAVYGDKYHLNSPSVKDTNFINSELAYSQRFIDQQRYFLEDGKYTLSLSIEDLNKPSSKVVHQQEIEVKKRDGISDLQFIESYNESEQTNILSKSGYDLIPFTSNYYNEGNNTLNFYFEYYDSKEQVVLLQTTIQSHSTNQLVNNLAMSKKSNGSKTPMLGSFSLNNIPTGTYFLVVNAINKDKEVVFSTKKLFFKINNDVPPNVQVQNTFASTITNKDTLKLYINYLYPIQSVSESIYADNQLQYDSLEMMQSFFYEFWNRRDPFTTESTWLEYLENVKAVNAKFDNGLRAGYLSDRGRIYLTHGSPNSISEEFLPKQFHPFEVWHYHQIGQERNVKFIFTNDRMPNEFRLVYSNKQGETSSFSDWNQQFESDYHNSYDPIVDSPFDYFKNPK